MPRYGKNKNSSVRLRNQLWVLGSIWNKGLAEADYNNGLLAFGVYSIRKRESLIKALPTRIEVKPAQSTYPELLSLLYNSSLLV